MIKPKLISAALLFVVADSMTNGASAITVELAKKCHALTDKAFPPRVIGNPAAGSAKGSGKDSRLTLASVSRTAEKWMTPAPRKQSDRARIHASASNCSRRNR